jgi:putative tryptophan/tyrosine transport system substrate-binding protein
VKSYPVIPGRREAARPESITTGLARFAKPRHIREDWGYGFRLSRFALGRNDEGSDRMSRRAFIAALAAAAAWPIAARAQDRTYRLGFLLPTTRQSSPVEAFFDELRINGFVEGKNLAVVPGGFEATDDNLAERAAALVRAAPDAIIAGPAPPLRALQAVTRTVPLIGMSEDMVGEGLVASLARPGGNITGISLLSPELDGKRQDILIEAVPGARRIAAIADSRQTPPYHLEALQHAARSRGVELSVFGVNGPEEIASAIDAAKTSGAEGLNFLATPLFSLPGTRNNAIVMERIAALRLPAIFQWPETAEAGALVGYGPRFPEMYRQRARMVVRILRGANPADMPVEQPARFQLVINLKAAKALGHEVPAGLVLRADEVIE